MIRVNENYNSLSESYLFSKIARRVTNYKTLHPNVEVISLGIGDVTRPLCRSVIEAMQMATAEMADGKTFRGYAPDYGYDFLIDRIVEHDYRARGIDISADEIFVNDGAKSALGHFGDILDACNVVAISDPVYPVYVDSSVMDGRGGRLLPDGRWSKIIYLSCPCERHFVPQLPDKRPDIIYLCSPNNPTGAVLDREQLREWVDYARRNQALILFDAAYEAFVSDASLPRSIYEIEGAKEVAAEFRSFSKTAGFTGVRCGHAVIPKSLCGYDSSGNAVSLNTLWRRHQSTKFNGTAYIVQRAAEAVYTPQGQLETRETIRYYLDNAKLILKGLRYAGFHAYGGENAPYIWMETPEGMSSWAFFDKLLEECRVVGTPGVGFGPSGEGYFRLTAFGRRESVETAIDRIKQWKDSPTGQCR